MSYKKWDKSKNGSQPIAIVGMASHFPDATTLYEFWNNIQTKKDSIVDVDSIDSIGYWKKDNYYDPDPTAEDKTYAYKAGFIPPIEFDPVKFKLPPLILNSISTAQLFSLYVAEKALADANLIDTSNNKVNREKIGVILGGAGNGNTSFSLAARQQAPYLKKIMSNAGLTDNISEDIIERLKNLYLEWNEDSFPGFLGNVACGRITSYFDLGGTSNMVDAACASSLAAMKAAIGELNDGSCDAVLTGGVNLENSIFSFMCFSKTPALSRTNTSRPFDEKSDGMMLGDGVGMLVLKRLDDAIEHGDRIYSVINSVSASSDGRAKSIFAPRYEGQVRALNSAYEMAQVSPADIKLVEAHGTGTASGDFTEMQSLQSVFGKLDIENYSIAVGSVKSQIGHTRCAAGAASMIKVAMALYHKVLPPTINIEKPNKQLKLDGSPFYINTETRPWIANENGSPRFGAVSAFGFGGTNYHVVLEEYEAEHSTQYRMAKVSDVVVFHAESHATLISLAKEKLSQFLGEYGRDSFNNYLDSNQHKNIPENAARFAFSAASYEEVITMLETAIKYLESNDSDNWEHPLGIYYKKSAVDVKGKVVALFPGQGSQYVNMGLFMANEFPEMREVIAASDKVMKSMDSNTISSAIFPVPVFDDDSRKLQNEYLKNTKQAQPALGTISLGYYKILKNMGFQADFTAGHSYGEITALLASNVINEEQFFKLSAIRGKVMDISDGEANTDKGSMLAAAISDKEANDILSSYQDIIIANYNSSKQCVFGGATKSIIKLQKELADTGVKCSLLPVSAAFHTSFVSQAHKPFNAELSKFEFSNPKIKLYSNYTGKEHSTDPDKIKQSIASQLINPVYFKQLIENIYDQGGRLFVEIGPKGVLAKLVDEILKGKDYSVVSLNPSSTTNDSHQFRKAIAKLLVEGVQFTDIDKYQKRENIEINNNSSVTIKMDGGFFLSKGDEHRREIAMREDRILMDKYTDDKVSESIKEMPPVVEMPPVTERMPETQSIQENNTLMSSSYSSAENIDNQSISTDHREYSMSKNSSDLNNILNSQIQAQHMVSDIHKQFQENQKDYIGFISSAVDKQCSLLDKYHDSEQLKDMIGSFSQSLSLLDKNQDFYHLNHELYFKNQQALMGGYSNSTEEASTIANSQIAKNLLENDNIVNSDLQNITNKQQEESVNLNTSKAENNIKKAEPVNETVPVKLEQSSSIEEETSPGTSVAVVEKTVPEVDPEIIKQLEGLNATELTQQLIEVISEKTGYPVDMIGIDMDLEADLGIDSIKRIEIVGTMFESFGGDENDYDFESDEYQDMDTFDIEQFSTIRKMIDFFMDSIDELVLHLKGEKVIDAEVTREEPEENESLVIEHEDNNSIQSAPMSMQPININNSDIQVSTEKTTSASSSASSTNSGTRNLGFVISNKEEDENTASKIELKDTKVTESESLIKKKNITLETPNLMKDESNSSSIPINRFEVNRVILSKPDQVEIALNSNQIWLITDDGKGLSVEVAKKLIESGNKVARLILSADNYSKDDSFNGVNDYILGSLDEKEIASSIEKITKEMGDIAGFIHIAPTSTKSKLIKNSFKKTDYETIKSIFLITKHLKPALVKAAKESKAYFITVSKLDGELGFSKNASFSLVESGISGLAKSLNYEWNNVFCRAIDIDSKLSKKNAALSIVEEIKDPDTTLLEVGRNNKGERSTIELVMSNNKDQGTELDTNSINNESVFLVTGGARGITAGCVLSLAKKYQPKFILLGRTDIESTLPEWSGNEVDTAALRANAIKHMQSNNQQPTPIKIETMLKDVMHIIEARNNIKEILDAGSKVIYVSTDVNNKKSVLDAITKTEKELGSITGIIHGAGNLADKKIEKKTVGDFDYVFDTKVRGLDNILNSVDETKLQHIILFSSVSGFFGNAGQTDYSMANEVLNKFAYLFKSKHKGTFVRSINWGPWDSGMVNDTLKKVYKERNIAIIPVEKGINYFVNEFALTGNNTNTQVIIGSSKYQTPNVVKSLNESYRISRVITEDESPILSSHEIDGKIVLPSTCAVSWAIENCENILPGYTFKTLDDFKVLKGIVFDSKNKHEYICEINPVNTDDTNDKLKTLKVNIFSENKGKILNHYSLRLTMSFTDVEESPVYNKVNLNDTAKLKEQIYNEQGNKDSILFHGPILQGLKNILNINKDGLTVECQLDSLNSNINGQFDTDSFDPVVADVMLQTPELWLSLESDKGGLPSSISKIEHFELIEQGMKFYITLEIESITQSNMTSVLIAHDKDGKIYSKFTGVNFTISKKMREVLTN
ncbi:MAG: SDR family NAD(P)-dependent oxidoreductase [Pseudomonadota bacterium]